MRHANEDAVLVDIDLGLFVVADGMGGHRAGEVASRLAVEAIYEFVARTRADDNATWPCELDPTRSMDANRLIAAIRLANRQIFRASQTNEAYAGMGTTVTAALVSHNHLVFSGVGDSRVYSFKGGTVTQLTHDDSWMAAVLESGAEVPETSLANHSMRHLLTNVVGAREDTPVEAGERMLEDGEVLLLCSDGLHGALDDRTITAILASEPDLATAVNRLVETALDRNGSDNITALLVQYSA